MGWFSKKKKDGCPACKEKNIISFGDDFLKSKFNSTIELTSEFPEIGIYQCSKCQTKYFQTDSMFQSDKFYNRIFDGQLELLQRWTDSDLTINSDFQNTLDQIGTSQNWNSEKVIPCSVQFKDGTSTDFAILKISNDPPLGADYDFYKSVHFIDEVEQVKPSEFALSMEIRKATETAEERRMGFYPTVTTTGNLKKVVLNGFEVLFAQDGIKGSDLTLSNVQWDHRDKSYLYSNHELERTLIIAKSK